MAVQLGQGQGRFQSGGSYSTGTGSFPADLAVADVNGDGVPDLLTVHSLGNAVGVRLGVSARGLGALTTYSTGEASAPSALLVVDVNGDGHLDLLTANVRSNAVGVLLGTGAGNFELVRTYSTGAQSGPLRVAVADVNGDGRLDLLTANSTTNAVGVLVGTPSGDFGPVTAYPAGPASNPFDVAVADVNGDGQLDVLTANAGSHTVGVLLGTGTGSFGPVRAYSTGVGSQPRRLAVADVNGDGKLDVVTADTGDATVGLLLGTGTGSVGAVLAYSAGPACYPQGIAVADVNGDGKPDLLTANSGSNTAGVLLQQSVLPTRAALPGTRATLAPNPAHSSVTLTATGLPGEVRRLEVIWYTVQGQALGQLVLPAAEGLVQAPVPTAGLPAGLYLRQLRALNAQGKGVGTLSSQRLSLE